MPKKVHWTPQQMEALFTTAISEKTYEHPHGKTKLAHELLTATLASMAMFPDTLSAVAVGQQLVRFPCSLFAPTSSSYHLSQFQ